MIGVRFDGRLGNQLFQYVFLKYMKEKETKRMVFFSNPHHAYIEKYFDLEGNDNFLLGSKGYSAITRVLPTLFSLKNIFIHNWVIPKPFKIKNNSLYRGYFQSAYYYEQLKKKPQFKIKKAFVDDFQNQYGELFANHKIVVVHIRRTDYMSYGERRKRDISLPMPYFKERLNAIENSENYKVIFVSDDMEHVKKVFPPQHNFIFSSNNEIIDFQIIQNADIAIISNSTFAWWACYLSPKKNKVYAPKNWFGFKIGREHPRGIMTDRFEWCDVNP
ncbi:alpha-1,2-fucosyltransferase [Pedobacter sp. SD-b]|uniref:Alpha-1,2-fucosyltransferase n=1 Tax=Pedobacter segetis TaxID=2793069 RepID=A0ABS1BFT0_9SPHI|nr:alpha-1,2-fucosyltransferase [Pedobacter segetis]MBK0381727.1 alpha-1,2-fucosyltransferase [Pedobacter segetis]